jgi:hypothetical protein
MVELTNSGRVRHPRMSKMAEATMERENVRFLVALDLEEI